MRDRRGAKKALRMGLAQAAPGDPDSYMGNGCYFLSFVLFKKGEELRARDDRQVNEVFEEAVALGAQDIRLQTRLRVCEYLSGIIPQAARTVPRGFGSRHFPSFRDRTTLLSSRVRW
jgi:hypothetical protein